MTIVNDDFNGRMTSRGRAISSRLPLNMFGDIGGTGNDKSLQFESLSKMFSSINNIINTSTILINPNISFPGVEYFGTIKP